MLPPVIKLLRDALFVFTATLFAGFIVSVSLGAAQRDTSVWLLAVNLTNAVLCITVFFISAHWQRQTVYSCVDRSGPRFVAKSGSICGPS
jgi:hypothetical protein